VRCCVLQCVAGNDEMWRAQENILVCDHQQLFTTPSFLSLSRDLSLSVTFSLSVSLCLSLACLHLSHAQTQMYVQDVRHIQHAFTITSTPARHTYNMLQHALQHTAALCNTLQRTNTNVRSRRPTHSTCRTIIATLARQPFNTLTATHCSTAHTATHCNTQQHAAMHCNTLQHFSATRSKATTTS